MQVYALQFPIVWEDKEANRKAIGQQLDRLKPAPGSLVALPELSCIGFTMRRVDLAEEPGGETERFYSELARKYQVTLVGGVSCWDNPAQTGLGRNVALVHGPDGQLLTSYCKMHPFSFAGETDHYQSGSQPVLFDWQGLRVAPLICYDLRFPELFRHLVLQGCEMFVVIANWPSARVAHWNALLQARAIENQAYVLGVNRCGQDPKLSYPGSSRLIDPQGQILTSLDEQPGVLHGHLETTELRAYRQRFPALQDVRLPLLGLESNPA